ncbi:hypothetical protein M1O29_02020 [Dehalococcoidia bacterium]|nr:hypothetical protein [Dehalococcoidia bacterium]
MPNPRLLFIISTLSLVLAACGGGNQPSETTGQEAKPAPNTPAQTSADPDLDRRFNEAVDKYVKSQWGTWLLGASIGQCFITNGSLLTRETREGVIEHGIEGAFDKLSGAHLGSLSKVWDLCEANAKTTSTSSPAETASATTSMSNTGTDSRTPKVPTKSSNPFNGLECTTSSNPQPVFTHPVMDEQLIGATMPPGLASTGMLKPHGYFFVEETARGSHSKDGWSGYPQSAPVHAPITSWLRSVYPYTSGAYGKDVPEPPVEYMLLFEVSCEVYYKLDHLGPLTQTIKAAGPFPVGQNTDLRTPLKVEGGDLVSYWSGVNPGGNVDLGVYNTTINRNMASQSRYNDGYHDAWLNEDCPFDYFPAELRDTYYELFTDINAGKAVGVQPCRTSAESDILGTISGMWFEPDKYGSVFSISTSMSGLVLATFQKHAETGGSFDIKVPPESATYVDPSEVTSKHCYESHGAYNQKMHPMYIDLELTSPTKLQVDYGNGTCTNRTVIETLSLMR